MLMRQGSKRSLAKELQRYFPTHELYIEPFFGAGGMFFNKTKAEHNFVNDNDSEIVNFYMCLKENPERLSAEILGTPKSEDLLAFWQKAYPINRFERAARLFLLSNCTLYSKGGTIKCSGQNESKIMLASIPKLWVKMQGVNIMNKGAVKFLKAIHFIRDADRTHAFCYCDPPYQSTDNNYDVANSFNMDSLESLIIQLNSMRIKYAISEFDNEDVIALFERYGLTIHFVKERRNIKNRRNEILATNYDKINKLF